MDAFLDSFHQPPHRAVRFSPRREHAPQAWCTDSVPWAEDAWYFAGDTQPGGMLLHWAGAFYIQEPSAMAAVTALDPQAGQAVLDLCAAPGGKSCQIAGLMAGEGLLLANEPVTSRARELSRNLERMGVINAVVTSNKPERLAEKFPAYFDRILIDAPCSGEGMFRKNPEVMKSWHPGLPGELSQLQLHILGQAAGMLKPGGRMVYSTCTFNSTENEGVIASFLRAHQGFSLKQFSLPGLRDAADGMLRIWPHISKGEGHFIALLEKAAETGNPAASVLFGDKTTKDRRRLLSAVNGALPEWMETPVSADGFLGDTAVSLPRPCPDLEGLFTLRLGLHLASLVGKTMKPNHALAAAMKARNRLQLDRKEAECFRRGETLKVSGILQGYCCAEYEGWPLGWGKALNGILKNHYPKGLRNSGNLSDG